MIKHSSVPLSYQTWEDLVYMCQKPSSRQHKHLFFSMFLLAQDKQVACQPLSFTYGRSVAELSVRHNNVDIVSMDAVTALKLPRQCAVKLLLSTLRF